MGGTMPFLSYPSRAALDRLSRDESAATPPDPLARVRGIRALTAALEAEPAMLQSVREALAGGSSWTDIADAAGLGPAAAKWRWQGTDDEIAARHDAGRKRAARPSSVPTDLPGLSVADAAARLGVTPQAVYLKVTRGSLTARTVDLPDGRKYKRVFLPDDPDTDA
jgi:hypothetical protein